MQLVLTLVARIGLVLTIVPAFLFLFDAMALNTVKLTMIIGTVMWLAAAPFVQKKHEEEVA